MEFPRYERLVGVRSFRNVDERHAPANHGTLTLFGAAKQHPILRPQSLGVYVQLAWDLSRSGLLRTHFDASRMYGTQAKTVS